MHILTILMQSSFLLRCRLNRFYHVYTRAVKYELSEAQVCLFCLLLVLRLEKNPGEEKRTPSCFSSITPGQLCLYCKIYVWRPNKTCVMRSVGRFFNTWRSMLIFLKKGCWLLKSHFAFTFSSFLVVRLLSASVWVAFYVALVLYFPFSPSFTRDKRKVENWKWKSRAKREKEKGYLSCSLASDFPQKHHSAKKKRTSCIFHLFPL